MAIRSLLFFVFLFCAYSLFLRLHKIKWNSNQNQFQFNIIKADRYIYRDTTPKGVILGTSLAARISEDSIPGIYNLAMQGMSVLDGFDILFKSKQFPEYVFIETNLFYKKQTDAFVQVYDSKIDVFLKNHFLAMREENQPIGILKHYIEAQTKRKLKKNMMLASPDVELLPTVFNELLTGKEKEYAHPDTIQIKSGLNKMTAYINRLQKRGTKIFFFEMPTDSRLEHLPLANYTRQLIKYSFPGIAYLPAPSGQFKTTDGVHLQPSAVIAYTNFFKSYSRKVMDY